MPDRIRIRLKNNPQTCKMDVENEVITGMLHVAITEDSAFDRQVLRACLEEYASEKKLGLRITEYAAGQDLIDRYPDDADLIFLDIMMDSMDGMTTARMIRRRDENVLIVFVTSMVQYAVQGYSVNAADFLVKPVNYTSLKLCLDRVLKRLDTVEPLRLRFSNREGDYRFAASEICYFESLNHKLIVHTTNQSVTVDSSLSAAEKMVEGLPFFRCHVSFLVNLRYVDRISGHDVWVNGDQLLISRYRRKDFLEAWSAWLG